MCPRRVAGLGELGRGVQDGCAELQGDSKLSIFNSDENGDDLANINMLKCCDSRHKRHFDVLTVGSMKFKLFSHSHRKLHHHILKIATHIVVYGSVFLME